MSCRVWDFSRQTNIHLQEPSTQRPQGLSAGVSGWAVGLLSHPRGEPFVLGPSLKREATAAHNPEIQHTRPYGDSQADGRVTLPAPWGKLLPNKQLQFAARAKGQPGALGRREEEEEANPGMLGSPQPDLGLYQNLRFLHPQKRQPVTSSGREVGAVTPLGEPPNKPLWGHSGPGTQWTGCPTWGVQGAAHTSLKGALTQGGHGPLPP